MNILIKRLWDYAEVKRETSSRDQSISIYTRRNSEIDPQVSYR